MVCVAIDSLGLRLYPSALKKSLSDNQNLALEYLGKKE